MNKKQIGVELAYFILVFYFFFEGISKMIAWSIFSAWLHNAPLLGTFYVPLTYIIPLTEVILSMCIIVPAARAKALLFTIVSFIGFILWVILFRTFIHTFFFYPYFDFWKNPTWMEKVLVSLLLAVIGLYALFQSGGRAVIFGKSSRTVTKY